MLKIYKIWLVTSIIFRSIYLGLILISPIHGTDTLFCLNVIDSSIPQSSLKIERAIENWQNLVSKVYGDNWIFSSIVDCDWPIRARSNVILLSKQMKLNFALSFE